MGSQLLFAYIITKDIAIRAPYLTKSTLSYSIGSSILIASEYIVPAHAIPKAIAVPYLIWGLYDKISNLIILGIYSKFLNNTNAKEMTEILLTSSETSFTA